MTPRGSRDRHSGRPARPRHRDSTSVTGAFSYSGAVIARHLLQSGRKVRTLTGHPERAGQQSDIEVRPLDFDDPRLWRHRWPGLPPSTTRTGHASPGAASTTPWRSKTAGPFSKRRAAQGPARSYTSRSCTPRRLRLTRTSGAKPSWSARSPRAASPTRSCGHRSSLTSGGS